MPQRNRRSKARAERGLCQWDSAARAPRALHLALRLPHSPKCNVRAFSYWPFITNEPDGGLLDARADQWIGPRAQRGCDFVVGLCEPRASRAGVRSAGARGLAAMGAAGSAVP